MKPIVSIRNLSPFGIGPNQIYGSTLSAAYFLERNKQLLLEVRQGKDIGPRSMTQSVSNFAIVYSPQVTMKQLSLHFKHFLGNSFYYRVGGDYNQVDYNYDLSKSYNGAGLSSSFSGDSLLANITIGNQWQWENFNLGCDWVGYAMPLMSRVSNQSAPLRADADYEQKSFETDKKYYLSDSTAILLRFYLGASF